jgi:hypothetical protein
VKITKVTFGILLFLFALVSCRYLSIPPVNDVRLISVALVPQSLVPAQDRYWNNGVITQPLLRVTISSDHDFQSLAQNWSYYIGQVTAFCEAGQPNSARRINGFPSLFDEKGRIDEFASKRMQSRNGKSGPIVYHLYFNVEQFGFKDWYTYDLRKRSEDICIQINGYKDIFGDVPIWGFRSDVVIAPREKLVSVLAD